MKCESTVWKTSYALEQAVPELVSTPRNNGSPYHAHHDSRWKGPSGQAHSKVHKGNSPLLSFRKKKGVEKGSSKDLIERLQVAQASELYVYYNLGSHF